MFKKPLKKIFRFFGLDICRYLPDWKGLDKIGRLDNIIDVGVGKGTPVLYERFPEAYLYLIEPLSEFQLYIKKNILSQRRGTLYPFGAGAKSNEKQLIVEKANKFQSSFLPRTEPTALYGDRERELVQVRPLDFIFREINLSKPLYNLLKLDTEGYELEVLKGAEETLQKVNWVVLECYVESRFKDSYTFEEVLALMNNNGFKLESVLQAGQDKDGIYWYLDLLFKRKSKEGG